MRTLKKTEDLLSFRLIAVSVISCVLAALVQYLPYNHMMSILFQAGIVGATILFCNASAVGLIPLLVFSATCSYINISVTSEFETYYRLNSMIITVFFLAVIVCLLINNKNVLMPRNVVPLILFCFFMFASQLWAENLSEYSSGFIAVCLAYTIVPFMIRKDEDVFASKLAFVLAGLVSAIFISIHIIEFGTMYESDVQVDRNYQSGFLLLCSLESLLFLTRYWKKLGILLKIIPIISIIGGAYVIVSSASRSGFIAIGIAILMFILTNLKYSKKIIAFVLIAAIVIYVAYKLQLFDFVLKRFEDETAEGGNGRLDLWHEYLTGYADGNLAEMLFGHGLTGISKYGYIAHNTFVSILYSFGLVGLTMFLYIITKTITNFVRCGYKDELTIIVPILLMNCTIEQYYRIEFAVWLAAEYGISTYIRKRGRKNGI